MSTAITHADLVERVCKVLIPTLQGSSVDRFIGERVPREDEDQINAGTDAEVRVHLKDGKSLPLNPRADIVNHSPSGVNWGYGGSGPAQLALAILVEMTGSPYLAQQFYQEYKREVISQIDSSRFELTGVRILEWLTPRIERFVHAHLEFMFDGGGTPDQMPFIATVRGGPDFSFEWNADGTLDRVDYSDETAVEPKRTRIDDFAKFYVETVFPAQAQ